MNYLSELLKEKENVAENTVKHFHDSKKFKKADFVKKLADFTQYDDEDSGKPKLVQIYEYKDFAISDAKMKKVPYKVNFHSEDELEQVKANIEDKKGNVKIKDGETDRKTFSEILTDNKNLEPEFMDGK